MGAPYNKKNWGRLRHRMVDVQIIGRGITDHRVLQAMRAVPRHRFVPKEWRADSYEDVPLPIGGGQTISQPYVVAHVTEMLQVTLDDSVLEIGTGSGYQAAVLARLTQRVFTVECIPALAQAAADRLSAAGVENVEVLTMDGGAGLPQHAPFPAILVSAAAPRVPRPLLAQLANGGRLVAPVGPRHRQYLQRWTKEGAHWKKEALTPVRFVPLTGNWGVEL